MNKRKQNRLTREIQEILDNQDLNPEEVIKDSEDQEEIDTRLEIAKDWLVRIVIISDYVMINEWLDVIIENYFFETARRNQIKRPRMFRQHILDRLSIHNKIELIDEFFKLRDSDRSFILALNGLRNALAHSFFPESRRREKALYKKKSIYKIEVLRQYKSDCDKTNAVLIEKAWGIRKEDLD